MQRIVNQILKNAFKNNRLGHAYLFEGPRGTGKREAAMELTKLFLCQSPSLEQEPCKSCSSCQRIERGNYPDLHIVEPEESGSKLIKKEQIQELQSEFSMAGMESDKKVYIIVHADHMTDSAANSLLKFLEEPNGHSIAILLTEQPSNILSTIRSRCQSLTFLPLSQEKFVQQLVDQDGMEEQTARVLSAITHNAGEAIAMDEEGWFSEAMKLTKQMAKLWFEQPMSSFIMIQESWISHFSEKPQQKVAFELLSIWLKDLLYLHVGKNEDIHFIKSREKIHEQALKTNPVALAECLSILSDTRKRMASNVSFQLCLEKSVISIIRLIHKRKK